MRRGIVLGLVGVALATGAVAAPAFAQSPPAADAPAAPEGDFAIIAPRSAREATRAREQEFYPGEDIRVRHEPAFVRGLSTAPAAGPIKRMGISGWTSPPGRGDGQIAHEVSGWFGFGFSIIWE